MPDNCPGWAGGVPTRGPASIPGFNNHGGRVKYKDAGVDIDRARGIIGRIGTLAGTTRRPGVMGGIGLFSGCFSFPVSDYREPVLVSGTDGVGTKILIAEQLKEYEGIGIDLVAMSVNDIITCGADPLFFLDYLAVGRLKRQRELAVVKGIADGCRQAGCALIGGETAQMSDVYGADGFDLAGFAVGVVEKSRMIDGSTIRPGDAVLGFPSSGLHSNGFSLVRKIFTPAEMKRDGKKLGMMILSPTRIYADLVRLLLTGGFEVRGIAHITGGGLLENVPRILPPGLRVVIDGRAWPVPEIFRTVREKGRVDRREMLRTFNMGIGLVMVAAQAPAGEIMSFMASRREPCYIIGRVEESASGARCLVKG